jgi:SAM-dependent methyltransferase
MPQMHKINHDGSVGHELGPDITYVDPSCEGKTWERIEAGSKSYVWGENCPVYTSFMRGTPQLNRPIGDEQLLNILRESHRILKPGGCVVFGEMSDFINKDNIKEIADYPKIKPDWKVRIKKAKKFLINFAHKSDVGGFYTTKEELIIFTKRAQAGGKRKGTMKRRKIRHRTRKSLR